MSLNIAIQFLFFYSDPFLLLIRAVGSLSCKFHQEFLDTFIIIAKRLQFPFKLSCLHITAFIQLVLIFQND